MLKTGSLTMCVCILGDMQGKGYFKLQSFLHFFFKKQPEKVQYAVLLCLLCYICLQLSFQLNNDKLLTHYSCYVQK